MLAVCRLQQSVLMYLRAVSTERAEVSAALFFSVTGAVKYIIIMVIVRASMESTGTADSRTKEVRIGYRPWTGGLHGACCGARRIR